MCFQLQEPLAALRSTRTAPLTVAPALAPEEAADMQPLPTTARMEGSRRGRAGRCKVAAQSRATRMRLSCRRKALRRRLHRRSKGRPAAKW
jgi:hypothetical protein